MNLKTIATALALLTASSSASAADCMLGAFFSSNGDQKLQVYRSEDGVHMDRIFVSDEISGRDPSLRFYNGAFYICLVEPAESGNTFKLLRSTNFLQWTTTSFNVIDRGGKNSAVWAPDLFIDDDGAAYVYFAKQREKKSDVLAFDIYVSKADSIESPQFRKAKKIELEYGNVIDAHVHKLDGHYYMIAKNEEPSTNNDNKSPLLFKSENPTDGFVEVKEFPLRAVRGYEGFSIFEDGGKIYIYGDNYSGKYDAFPTSHHTVWIADAKDIETGPYRAEYVESARTMRHGSMILIDDPNFADPISQLRDLDAEEKTNSELETRLIDFTAEDFGGQKNEIDIGEFAPAPNVIYRVRYKNRVSIARIVNAYGVDKIRLVIAPGASIKIDNVFLRDNDGNEDKYYDLPMPE